MIRIDKLSKKYGKLQVLNEVSLIANPSEIVGIVGDNGTGKTTILTILAGLLSADSGSVRMFNTEVLNKRGASKYCSYIPQENPLYEDMNVYDNMTLLMAGPKVKIRIGEAAEKYGLSDKMSVKVNRLSGGMKRRVTLACALSEHKPILLMDEPTVALDRESRSVVNHWVIEHKEKGGIVLMSTHEKEQVNICDKIYVLKDGKLCLEGKVSDEQTDLSVQI